MNQEVAKKIQSIISSNPVVLFMKGVPDFPQCGFSARTVGCLEEVGSDFVAVDVLADPDVREGIKQYSKWPTIPQLYINGEFIGGCDIVSDMYEKGELKQCISADVS